MKTTQTFEQAADSGKVELLLTDARGVYLPRDFAQQFVVKESSLDDSMTICATSPEHEQYWDAWIEILDNGTIEGKNGFSWTLYQDGNLWAIREDANIDWDTV